MIEEDVQKHEERLRQQLEVFVSNSQSRGKIPFQPLPDRAVMVEQFFIRKIAELMVESEEDILPSVPEEDTDDYPYGES